MGRPRQPDVPYEAPRPGERAFLCTGACGLVWPERFRGVGSKCRNCRRATRQKTTREENRATHLRGYGVTPERVDEMLREQKGLCPICLNEIVLPTGNGGVRRGEAVVDHDHTTGGVRGLLCSTCNLGLGYLADDLERLQRAVRYLGGDDVMQLVAELGGRRASEAFWTRIRNRARKRATVRTRRESLLAGKKKTVRKRSHRAPSAEDQAVLDTLIASLKAR